LNRKNTEIVKSVAIIPRDAKEAGTIVQGESHFMYSTGSLVQPDFKELGTKPFGHFMQ
jgi:hypothetical protein